MKNKISPVLQDGYTELFGAMGSGKSCLYNALLNEKNIVNGKKYFFWEIFLRQLCWKRPLRSTLAIIIYIFSPDRRWFFNCSRYIEQGGVISPDAQVLIDYVYSYFQSFDLKNTLVLKRRKSLFDACCQYSLTMNHLREDKFFLFDESIVQRCLSLAIMLDDPRDFIAEYIGRAPCPKKIIFVTVDRKTISSRISARKNRHSILEQERAFSSQWIVLDELKKKGVNVLQVKGNEPTIKNASLVKFFLNDEVE